MTKTWSTVLAALLGLATAANIHAAEPPEFLNLPPTEIKVAPLPLDTKAPVLGTYAPACNSYPAPFPGSACTTCCSDNPHAGWGLGLGGLGNRLQGILDIGDRDHPCMDKFLAWLTYRPCHLTPPGACCCYIRPRPANYEWFLYPGCAEGSCGGCGKAAGCYGGCGK